MNKKKQFLLIFTLFGSYSLFSKDISCQNGRLFLSPPNIPVAIYLDIKNSTGNKLELIEVTSNFFGSIEIHKMETKNGMMAMKQVSKLQIPNGTVFSFSPGSYHIMASKIKKPLKEGQLIDFQLVFSKKNLANCKIVVKKRT